MTQDFVGKDYTHTVLLTVERSTQATPRDRGLDELPRLNNKLIILLTSCSITECVE